MLKVIEFINAEGESPFGAWFAALDPFAGTKIQIALARIELGNLSNVKGVGGGVLEYRIDFGPGYRIYFGRDGDALIILLCGGTKRRQDQDIETARELWQSYKRRKKGN
jgi:putative addiction module killer protein